MERFRAEGPPLIKLHVEGQGMKWVDPRHIRESDYDPEVIKMGGAESFAGFMQMGIGAKVQGKGEGQLL